LTTDSINLKCQIYLTSPESRVQFEVIHKPCMEVGWCSDGSPAGITKLLRVVDDPCHLLTPGQRTELHKFGLGGGGDVID
jgi:hypothetical protein